ncbi:MAG: DUF58 domain-containing protein [Victivallales bacterium]|nr:DUF58 domain-containing protein [Victivallales bacterium]
MRLFIPAPTARGWILVFLALASFAVTMVNANPSTALVAALFAGALGASFIFAVTSVSGLRVFREPSDDGCCGSRMALPLLVRNIAWRPRQSVIVRERMPFVSQDAYTDFAVGPLAANEERRVERSVPLHRRGTYMLNEVWLVGGDSMGIFKASRKFELPTELVIYPASVRISQIPLDLRDHSRVFHNGRPLGVSGQGQEIFGLRDYRTGDPFRLIHWKASARRRKIVTKEFEANAVSSIVILLDSEARAVGEDALDNNFEFIISLAATLAGHLAGVYCNITFISGSCGDGGMYLSGTAYSVCRRIQRELADINACGTCVADLLEANYHVFQPGSLLYCLSMTCSDRESRMLGELADRGVEVRSIYAPKRLFPSDAEARLKAGGLDTEGSFFLDNTNLVSRVVFSGMDMEDALACTG